MLEVLLAGVLLVHWLHALHDSGPDAVLIIAVGRLGNLSGAAISHRHLVPLDGDFRDFVAAVAVLLILKARVVWIQLHENVAPDYAHRRVGLVSLLAYATFGVMHRLSPALCGSEGSKTSRLNQ